MNIAEPKRQHYLLGLYERYPTFVDGAEQSKMRPAWGMTSQARGGAEISLGLKAFPFSLRGATSRFFPSTRRKFLEGHTVVLGAEGLP